MADIRQFEAQSNASAPYIGVARNGAIYISQAAEKIRDDINNRLCGYNNAPYITVETEKATDYIAVKIGIYTETSEDISEDSVKSYGDELIGHINIEFKTAKNNIKSASIKSQSPSSNKCRFGTYEYNDKIYSQLTMEIRHLLIDIFPEKYKAIVSHAISNHDVELTQENQFPDITQH